MNLPAGDENLPDSSKSPGKIVNSNICLVNCGRKTEVRTLCGKSQKSDFHRRFCFRFTELRRFAGVIFLKQKTNSILLLQITSANSQKLLSFKARRPDLRIDDGIWSKVHRISRVREEQRNDRETIIYALLTQSPSKRCLTALRFTICRYFKYDFLSKK